jgi:hypothetical protein
MQIGCPHTLCNPICGFHGKLTVDKTSCSGGEFNPGIMVVLWFRKAGGGMLVLWLKVKPHKNTMLFRSILSVLL